MVLKSTCVEWSHFASEPCGQDLETEQSKLVDQLTDPDNDAAKAVYLAFSAAQRRLTEEEGHEQAVLTDAETDLDATLTGICQLQLPLMHSNVDVAVSNCWIGCMLQQVTSLA